MRWKIAEFTLDTDAAELVSPDGLVHMERQPYSALVYLIENADRVVSREELIEAVWNGRFISDSAVSTVIKQVRKALGDNGTDQAFLRTVHGVGFRFVGRATQIAPSIDASAKTQPEPQSQPATGTGRPSIGVLRFLEVGDPQTLASMATALPAEIISGLSRLHWLHIISRGSSFQFDPKDDCPDKIGSQLGVRYLVTGFVEHLPNALNVHVELLSTQDGALIWSDRYSMGHFEIEMGRNDIVSSIVSALDLEIPRHEADATRLLSDAQFDAWSHFHLGLAHIYRFDQHHNHLASEHFDAALALEPGFSRAHSGKSFVHWQNAFMRFGSGRSGFIRAAAKAAETAMQLDPLDPFAAFNLGRAQWLEGNIQAGLDWLDRALKINPNSAQSHYNRGLLQVLNGAPSEGVSASDIALSLSPLDPLSYAMLSTQSMAALEQEDFEKAAALAARAVQSPSAHFYIRMIAAAANELNGDREVAATLLETAKAQRPKLSQELFFNAFPFAKERDRNRLRQAFVALGVE
ncbi:MAG: winged helix-turn-helix domain-containing protein [Pseudomonadota bacterium]